MFLAVLVALAIVLGGPALDTGWPASLAQFLNIQNTAKAGIDRAGASGTATEAYLQTFAVSGTSSGSRGIDYVSLVLLAWNFAPYAGGILLVVGLGCAASKRRSLHAALCAVVISSFVITSLVVVTIAYFRSEASLRTVAITRFEGDGGFRELTPAVSLPLAGLTQLDAGDAAMGSSADRQSAESWRDHLPKLTVLRVPLGDGRAGSSSVALWVPPSGSYNYAGAGAKEGLGAGALMTGVSAADAFGVVTDIGASARVLGFVTWGFGLEDGSGQSVSPRPCGSSSSSPPAESSAANVCGVSGWVSTQAVALGQRDKQLAAIRLVQAEAVADTLDALAAAAPAGSGVANASSLARATIVTQISGLRDVLSARRADVAYANDVYAVYTALMVGLYVLLEMSLVAVAVCRQRFEACVLSAIGLHKPAAEGGAGVDDAAPGGATGGGSASPAADSTLGGDGAAPDSAAVDSPLSGEPEGAHAPRAAEPPTLVDANATPKTDFDL